MSSEQPLACCICAAPFFATAGGPDGHLFRAGVCSYGCNTRKAWRAMRSVLDLPFDPREETHAVAHTDEEQVDPPGVEPRLVGS